MAEICYNTDCPYCVDYQCRRTCTCDMRLDGEYVKVKHGWWIKNEDGVVVCSECGEIALQRLKVHFPDWVTTFDTVKSNYCPNCGAIMDEVEE